ncbi:MULTISPECIES: hypothetical protein [Nitrosopumilus]|uniref:Uncharacterized protein n=1 Tax=Nitrosopumilus piranensis TaxID=1582439 RepID=A0A0C5BTE5_9ARCH|nr:MULTISPECIES: hypothetical protein [Nitrosopumilus]AJM91444.1 conserved exported protein of unknown function [Nitrosopumilus piranensis]KAF6245919.1 hypothetical protein C6989_02010 [Nitrosopumilus sp. b2]
MKLSILLLLLVIPGMISVAYGHTIDAVGEYRVEIGWMNEPVVSGDTNAIEFYASPLIPCPEISEPRKCAESQQFQNGIEGLKKTLKMQLIYKDEMITLPLSPDHDIPGKYYAFVNPTVSGFYQANVLGAIEDTPISLSMHPPKVAERAYIEFPEPSDITVQQMIDGHTALIENIGNLKDSVSNLEETRQQMDVGYAGIGVGIIAIVIAIIALTKSKNN